MRLLVFLLFAAALTSQSPPAASFRVEADIQYANVAKDGRRNRLDLYLPTGVANPPLVMFVHGGTWMTGSKEGHRFVGETLARHGFAAAVINYRLSPFARHPEHVEDCAAAFAWLYQHAKAEHFDPDRMFVMGHSAGGHLIALLALDDRYLTALQVPIGAIKGALGLSGVYDVRARNAVLDGVFGRDPKVRADASPFLHATAAAPPFLLLWADNDIPGLAFCARMLRERLRALAVPVQDGELRHENHASYLLHMGRADDQLSQPVFAFLDARLAALAKPAPPQRPRGEVRVQTDLVYGDAARQRFDLYLPDAPQPPVLVYAHGSLWDHGGRADASALAMALAAQGIAVVSIDYALAPGVYPTALQDLAAATAHVRQHAAELGVDAHQLFVGGNGGGAMLAIGIGRDPRWLQAAGITGELLRGIVALSPPADLERDRPEFAVFPVAARRQLSPLALAAQQGAPMLLLFGGADEFAADARQLQQLLQAGRQNIAFELPARATADVLATAGTAHDEITALVLAFLRR